MTYPVMTMLDSEDSILTWPGPLIILDDVGYCYHTTSFKLEMQDKEVCMCCPEKPLNKIDCELLAEGFLKSDLTYALYIVGYRDVNQQDGVRIFFDEISKACAELWKTKGDFLQGFIGMVKVCHAEKLKSGRCRADCQLCSADTYKVEANVPSGGD